MFPGTFFPVKKEIPVDHSTAFSSFLSPFPFILLYYLFQSFIYQEFHSFFSNILHEISSKETNFQSWFFKGFASKLWISRHCVVRFGYSKNKGY